MISVEAHGACPLSDSRLKNIHTYFMELGNSRRADEPRTQSSERKRDPSAYTPSGFAACLSGLLVESFRLMMAERALARGTLCYYYCSYCLHTRAFTPSIYQACHDNRVVILYRRTREITHPPLERFSKAGFLDKKREGVLNTSSDASIKPPWRHRSKGRVFS